MRRPTVAGPRVRDCLNNGELSRRQSWQVARLNCGPQAVLTAFTAAEAFGLRGWERDCVHVLAPAGAAAPRAAGVPIRLHRTDAGQQLLVQAQCISYLMHWYSRLAASAARDRRAASWLLRCNSGWSACRPWQPPLSNPYEYVIAGSCLLP